VARRVVTRQEVAEVRAAGGGALSRVRTTKVKKPAFKPGDITAWLSATLPTSCAVELAASGKRRARSRNQKKSIKPLTLAPQAEIHAARETSHEPRRSTACAIPSASTERPAADSTFVVMGAAASADW